MSACRAATACAAGDAPPKYTGTGIPVGPTSAASRHDVLCRAEVFRSPGEQRYKHLERFAGHLVPPVVVGVVTVGGLLDRIAAGDDVQVSRRAVQPGEGIGLLRQQGRRRQAGPHGHDEANRSVRAAMAEQTTHGSGQPRPTGVSTESKPAAPPPAQRSSGSPAWAGARPAPTSVSPNAGITPGVSESPRVGRNQWNTGAVRPCCCCDMEVPREM